MSNSNVTIGCCVPPHMTGRNEKLVWLASQLAKVKYDFFMTPQEFFGEVTGDLMSRRGTVTHSDIRNQFRIIHARVPLAEMFGYATVIRGLTQGRASYTMEPDVYTPVPAGVAAKVSGGLW